MNSQAKQAPQALVLAALVTSVNGLHASDLAKRTGLKEGAVRKAAKGLVEDGSLLTHDVDGRKGWVSVLPHKKASKAASIHAPAEEAVKRAVKKVNAKTPGRAKAVDDIVAAVANDAHSVELPAKDEHLAFRPSAFMLLDVLTDDGIKGGEELLEKLAENKRNKLVQAALKKTGSKTMRGMLAILDDKFPHVAGQRGGRSKGVFTIAYTNKDQKQIRVHMSMPDELGSKAGDQLRTSVEERDGKKFLVCELLVK